MPVPTKNWAGLSQNQHRQIKIRPKVINMPTYNEGVNTKQIVKIAVVVVLGIIGLIALFGSFYTVTSGQEGVLLRFNRANPVPKEAGLHMKIPLIDRVVKFDMRTQNYGISAVEGGGEGGALESASSADLQVVSVRLALNYHLSSGKSAEMFKNVGVGYEDTVITPTIHEATKAAMAQYNAEDLIVKRENVRADIENLLKQKLAPYNIIVEQVLITNFDFSKQFNEAIEGKVTAEQLALKEQRNLDIFKFQAQQVVAKAEGDRDAAIAQATGEAEKVRLVQEQLKQSPQYIEYIKAQRWDGKYPTFYLTGDSSTGLLMTLPSFGGGNASQ
jgi:prohibitin 2